MSEDYVKRKVAQYLLLQQDIKRLQEQQKDIKSQIDPYLDEASVNTRGSFVIPFTDSLQVGEIKYKAVQRVRKESKTLNEERALEFLRAKAVDASPDGRPFTDSRWLKPIIHVAHVEQDALWDLFVNDYISQEELDSFFDISSSFAFMPTRE